MTENPTNVQCIKDALRRYDQQLSDVNQKIWSNPELAYEEHKAHDAICSLFEALSSEGYKVTRHAYGVDTAFEVVFSCGSGGRTVAFNAEYDALPGIGHACGHNLIATSSVGAFIATCEALKAAQLPSYTVKLFGTPAEEGGGGKLLLINGGAYKGVDACLMVHPMPTVRSDPNLLGFATAAPGGFLANNKVRVTYTGKASHAAAAPWEGTNALDAVVAAYVDISLLRQQILPSSKIHGIVVHGGDRPNIIPNSTTVEYYVRAVTSKQLKELTARVVKCFEAAAMATGCKVEYEWFNSYMDLKTNKPICDAYVEAMQSMGHNVIYDSSGMPSGMGGGSTDMGNVSYECPGFHGMFSIDTPDNAVNHTAGFTAGAGKPEAYKRSIDTAAGMAAVACRVFTDAEFANQVKRDFEKDD